MLYIIANGLLKYKKKLSIMQIMSKYIPEEHGHVILGE